MAIEAPLLATVAGLAALDAFNPATIAGMALILVLPSRRPLLSAVGFVAGAYGVVVAVGAAVFFGADAASESLSDGFSWVRRLAFGAAAVVLVVAALRRLRARPRRPVSLPSWFGPWTAAPLGVLVTGADLPNAFPYVLAIERLLAADVAAVPALVVLAGYGVVYCLPCLVLLLVGALRGDRVRRRLRVLHERFGSARTVPRSVPMAVGLALVGIAVGGLAVAI
jgi:hypothetical protein